ncbi:hypothetical protein GWI33_002752 [Rhynchophorus ferrugineus]|uniref:FLYWCH-type domain-containing protein n=1 Tax=Rhynchophorus ferrugineus TaxID=354439 RepID=A0A834MJF4_RHYFE|nr:hypothetical protein GWI33_002752 [Rhynchophorus ferrugineus]
MVIDGYEYKLRTGGRTRSIWRCICEDRTKYTVHFLLKRKLPMLILRGYEYRIKRRTDKKTLWICTKEYLNSCRSRVYTFGNTLHAKVLAHTHPPTFRTIYFRKGKKRPIMVFGQYEYKVERQSTSTNMCWCCLLKEKLKCKARIITFHDHVVVKRIAHNHPPTFNGDYAMEAKNVTISYQLRKSFTKTEIVKTLKQHKSNENAVLVEKGKKRPIMVLGQYEYKVERQSTPTNMCWCCLAKEKLKCKARVITFHDHVVVKRIAHNHPPTFKGDCTMEAKNVTISYELRKTFTKNEIAKTLHLQKLKEEDAVVVEYVYKYDNN